MCAPMPELSGNVLLLEDNLIVSLDVEEILKELGAQNVYSADTVKDALGLVDAHSYSFALLDVKLSDGDVFPVADRLLHTVLEASGPMLGAILASLFRVAHVCAAAAACSPPSLLGFLGGSGLARRGAAPQLQQARARLQPAVHE